MAQSTESSSSSRGAFFVGAGIFLSRIMGLLRERVLAHYLGNSMASAAFKAALRIPNFLQNLFGEGVLSASFIPVYASLLGKDDQKEANIVANAVFGLLSLVTAILVSLGVFFTPLLIDLVAPGFSGETRALTINLVRIIFPGVGLLVLSAWCLGILNSHRRFFIAYMAPVLWNAAIIFSVLIFGFVKHVSQERLALCAAYGVAVGCLLQFAIQWPAVSSLLGQFKPNLKAGNRHIRQVLKSFGPVVLGRGVVQVSAYIDTAYASLISERALSALAYAQALYLIPISLFGMAVSAAELPEMSRSQGSSEEVASKIAARINNGLRRIAFFVIPSTVCLFCLGDIVGGALFQTGKFNSSDTRYLWYLLMGSTCGLVASTMGRLYASAFYALRDTKTPLYFAALRVILTAALAYWSAVKLPGVLGVSREMGGVGITATTGFAAWIEFLLLRRRLSVRIGKTGLSLSFLSRLWGSAVCAGALSLGIKMMLTFFYGTDLAGGEIGAFLFPMPQLHPWLTAMFVLIPFTFLYLALTSFFKFPEALALKKKILR